MKLRPSMQSHYTFTQESEIVFGIDVPNMMINRVQTKGSFSELHFTQGDVINISQTKY